MNNLHNKQVIDVELICISRSSNRSVLWCQAKVLLGDDAMMSQEFTNPVLKKKKKKVRTLCKFYLKTKSQKPLIYCQQKMENISNV